MLKRLLLLWLSLSSLCLAPALAGPQEWSFGTDPGDARARGRDLFSLGVLGAKATDAIRGEPQAGTGLQRFEGAGDTGPDLGSAKLAVPPPRSTPAKGPRKNNFPFWTPLAAPGIPFKTPIRRLDPPSADRGLPLAPLRVS